MSQLIASLVLASSLIAATAPAFAGQYGNALAETANSNLITPHGVWDGK